ncbi:unnamed protein product [Orchesella dallaii]|uniref:ABC transporter domain-containing protein n=1 Tax=Orchesella dallaii TaxID=48710 RepID=A0ABP1RBN0_9HEXA
MATDLLKSDPILLRCITKNEVNLLSPTNQSSVLESNRFMQNNNVLSETDKDGISFRKDIISPPSEQSNDSAAAETLAVSVRNLYLAYEKSHPIISNLNMSVRKGTVYGLLGSSGCGKTTLLNCMVGLKKWDLGEILVFNKRPGATSSEIPGAKLGYMPQDIALYDQLSVKEMLQYYGQLYGMPEKEVGEQITFLIEFLKLPSKSNLIKELSGGQKRRVSLALALVHSPELLILDEPTVGLDPLLRESIWEYLFKMVEIRKSTVIITTHYIEEARFSNVIGVMRKGCLLVENSPDFLLKQFDCNLLEQVILKLCQKATSVAVGNDGKNGIPHSGYNTSSTSTINYSKELMPRDDPINRKAKSSRSKTSYNVREKFQENWELRSRRRTSISMEDSDEKRKAIRSSTMFQRIQALSTVMWLLLFRHPIFTSMTLFLPAIQILLTVSVLGKDPNGMKIGVVNQELPGQSPNCPYQLMEKKTEFLKGIQNKSCDMTQLGCHFMKELNLVESIEAVPIRSLEVADQEVKNGNLWGYIIIPTNYSQNVVDFAVEQRFARNETLIGSRISFKMDMSNYLGAAIAIRSTFEAYASFMKTLAISCGFDPNEFQLPFLFREPVYGNNDASYHDFVTPVIFITVIFEMPMLVTSILFINDRKLGTLDRARVAGLRFKEVMASYMVTQGSIIIGQTIVCYAMVWTIYEFNVMGSMSLFFAVVLLCGVCGASLGLLCGIFFRDEVGVLMFGAFLAPTLLCYEGALWPLEAIPWIPWRAISYASPTTLLCASFRSIVSRGLGLTHSLVWPGIAVMSAHTVLYWVLSTLLFIGKSK